jgi:hypothetical protein
MYGCGQAGKINHLNLGKYVNDHPEKLHGYVAIELAYMYEKYFPCKAK